MVVRHNNLKRLKNLSEENLHSVLVHPRDGYLKNSLYSITAYLVQTAFEQGKNIYIGSSNKLSAQNLTMSGLLTVAINLLPQRTSFDLSLCFKHPDRYAFIKDRISYQYGVFGGKPHLVSKVKGGVRRTPINDPGKSLLKYFIVDEKYCSDRKCHSSLNTYKSFYSKISGSNQQPPSFYNRKIVVVCNKSALFEKLRKKSLIHCIPIASIASGYDEYIQDTLPIDPLVLIASDYSNARDYMLHHPDIIYEYLVLSGDSRINRLRSQVKNDCNNKLFKSYCLVGNQAIANDNSICLWHWSNHEEALLQGKKELNFSTRAISGCDNLTKACEEFYRYLDHLEDEWGGLDCFRETEWLLRNILSDKLGISGITEESIDDELIRTSNCLLSDGFDEESVDDMNQNLRDLLYGVFNAKDASPSIWDEISKFSDSQKCLVVPKNEYDEWMKRSENYLGLGLSILKCSEFCAKVRENLAPSNYYFTFLPKYSIMNQLLSLQLLAKAQAIMILYPPEVNVFQARLKKLEQVERQRVGIKSRELIPELNFTDSDLIGGDPIAKYEVRGYGEEYGNSSDNNFYEYDIYAIEVENQDGKTLTKNCPHRILKKEDDGITLIAVTELEAGDSVLIYENKKRDYLYNILSEESERFRHIEYYSSLWKNRTEDFLLYCDSQSIESEDVSLNDYSTQRLSILAKYVGAKQDYILKNWIGNAATIRFPQKSKMDHLLSFLHERGLINSIELTEIASARSYIVGIMISLGANLSTETQSILLESSDGLDEYIEQNVCHRSDMYPLLSKFDVNSIKSIVRNNYTEWQFIKILGNGNLHEEQ